jgi:hypothetical protein
MRRISLGLVVCVLAGPASAGLFGGNDAPGRIPVPARDFQASVVDDSGVKVALKRMSLDGEVYFFGALGKAQVTVPFEEVALARFEDGIDEDHTVAVVTTKSGDEVRLVLDADRPIFGHTSFGNYRIDVADVAELIFP